MLPYPTADQAMKYSSEIAGPGNFYNFTLFQDALTKNGISTDGYQKVTVLAIEDSRFQDFMTTYASKFTADQIKQILQYHIIPDQTLYMASTFATLSTPIKFKTLSGEEIQFSRTNDTNDFYVGHPGVSEEDYPGYGYLTFFASDGNDKGVKNGVLQALNEVLIPPALVSNLPPPTEAPVPTEDPNATGTFTMPTESFTMTEDPSLTATAEAEPSSSDAADGAPAQATTTSAPKSTLIKPSGAAGKVGGMMAAAAAVLGALLMLA